MKPCDICQRDEDNCLYHPCAGCGESNDNKCVKCFEKLIAEGIDCNCFDKKGSGKMKRISFNKQFVNEAGNDLIPGKIHTIRQNYDFWNRFEGQEVELFTWEGKPYYSKQNVFCVKRIIHVQKIFFINEKRAGDFYFLFEGQKANVRTINENNKLLYANDGFQYLDDFFAWFNKGYKTGEMAVLHFTDFKYKEYTK